MSTPPLLHAKGLIKHFPVFSGLFRKQVATVQAVNGIDLTVYKGEVVGVVGESGCGKSTAARAAIRLIEPTAGSLTFAGQDILALSKKGMKKLRRHIQMIFQDPFASLNPRKTVAESLGEPLTFHEMVKDDRERDERVVTLLEQVGLSSAALNKYPHEFSGGQQQRICIGRAIALEPRLIVCDECVSALDVSIQAQILNLLTDLREKKDLSYLFISHNLSVVQHLCSYVVVLYMGKIMEQGPTKEVFSSPKHPYTQALLSAIPKAFPWEKKTRILLKGDLPSPLNPPSGCPFRTRCPYARPECAQAPPHRVHHPDTSLRPQEYWCILD